MKKESRFDNLFGAVRAAKSNDEPSSTSQHLDVQMSEHSDGSIPKSKDPNYQRTTIYLPKTLHRQLRAAAIADEREMSDVIEKLIEEWLATKEHS